MIMDDQEWERIAFEVARNQVGARRPVDDLILELALTPLEFEALCGDLLFKRKVRAFAKELTENGASFALKAQVQAEALLATQFLIATNKETPPSVAATMIANTVRWAGLEKRAGETDMAAIGGPKVSISINLGAAKTAAIAKSPTKTKVLKQAVTIEAVIDDDGDE